MHIRPVAAPHHKFHTHTPNDDVEMRDIASFLCDPFSGLFKFTVPLREFCVKQWVVNVMLDALALHSRADTANAFVHAVQLA